MTMAIAAGAVVGAAAVLGARVPASLYCTELPNVGFVYFDFNPNDIKISRTGKTGSMASPGNGGAQKAMQKADPATITLSEIVFEGLDTKLRCDTLLTWTAPASGVVGMVAAIAGYNIKTQPAPLTFQWGPPVVGFMYSVVLQSVNITYNRFTSAGIPTRAKLNLTMYDTPSLLATLPQNPTSGGLTGRRRHTVAHGESLVSIATANYGNPGAWRRIAEVNGIKDPAKVRPGTTIYLPNPEELAS